MLLTIASFVIENKYLIIKTEKRIMNITPSAGFLRGTVKLIV